MSEIRTLLLTDVVDSTRLSEQLGDAAMAQLWAAHDRVARDLLPLWNGREIDKTDGMLLLFEQPAQALQYALAYHQAMAGLSPPLRARAGLHVGPVILRENPAADIARGGKPLEVDGIAKPTTARIMSLACGGQILLSPEAHEALAGELEALGLGSTSHGHWVLKGVQEPVELFEAGPDPGLFNAPPDGDKAYRVVRSGDHWIPVKRVPNNLPEQPNAFVGRHRELIELKQLLRKARLITLLGMGGLGKTRLSLQVAAELMAEVPDGVWFLDLAPLRDGNLVLAEAAQVLGVREEAGRPLLQSLGQQLKDHRALLVVDNCEHLLKPAASLVHAVLKSAPRMSVLTSSRAPLRVPGEQTYSIQPLPLPGTNDDMQALQRSTAVRLFVERAQEQRPEFELSDENAAAVGELVARLEGIPLALELAAARMRAMTVADINRRLKNRFKLLTGGASVRDERQQTLRGLVDWSYDMLEDNEKSVLQTLAVFSGGFDLDAAEAVCADGEAIESDDVLDLLTSLVEKSLVSMEQREGEGRFRMLETIREYAAEKLDEAGPRDAAAARHCAYYFDFAKKGRNGMQGPKQGEWLDRLDLEQDNLRAAMSTAEAGAGGVDPLVAVKMAVALQNFWIMRGGCAEGRERVNALLALPAVQALPMAQAFTLYVGAALAWTQGALAEALRMLEQCLALRRGIDAKADVAATLSTLGVTYLSSGDPAAARGAVSEAVALFRESGYRNGEAIALLQLGEVKTQLGLVDEAREELQAALRLAQEIKHPETEGEAELALAELSMHDGRSAAAEQHIQRSLSVCTGAGDKRGAANAVWALGRFDHDAGRRDAARACLSEALAAFDALDMRGSWVGCLEDIAVLAHAQGESAAACPLAAVAQRLREGAHLRRSPRTQLRWDALLAGLQSALGEPAFQAAWAQGEALQVQEAQRRALGLMAEPPQAAAPGG